MPPFAWLRLLRARLSHSRGSSAGNRSPLIYHPSLSQGGFQHEPDSIAITINVLRSDHNDIHGKANPNKVLVNCLGKMPTMNTRFNNQHVKITVRTHLASDC